jgi:hypothetical protein
LVLQNRVRRMRCPAIEIIKSLSQVLHIILGLGSSSQAW